MKRLLLILTISFSLFTSSSFANESEVSKEVLKSFTASFKNASEVNWTTVGHYYKVSFSMEGQYISAFYNREGDMVAMAKNISSQQLPLAYQVSLKNNYDQYWITDLFELTGEDGISYYITLESATSKVILKSGSDGTWMTFTKSSK
jgi:hypothetical protein